MCNWQVVGVQVEQNRCKDRALRKAVTLGSPRTGVIAHVHPETSISGCQFVTVHPRVSTLRPGQAMMCVVRFYALGLPAFYEVDLVCEVSTSTIDHHCYVTCLQTSEFNSFSLIIYGA